MMDAIKLLLKFKTASNSFIVLLSFINGSTLVSNLFDELNPCSFFKMQPSEGLFMKNIEQPGMNA